MRKFVSYIIFTLLLAAMGCACSDTIDIRQDYAFEVTNLPVPKKLKKGEVAEIRCQILREGRYDNTSYKLRYYQPDGLGELKLDDGTVFLPNDYYDLSQETFRLYYTSLSEDQQLIDVYFFDSFGNDCMLSFSFNSDSKEEDE